MSRNLAKVMSLLVAVFFCLTGCGGGNGSDGGSTIQMGGARQGNVLTLTGTVSTFAGSAGSSAAVDGIGSTARLNYPGEITTDGANLYVADAANHTIRRVEIATATVTTLAGSAGVSGTTDGIGSAARFFGPQGITTDGTNIYVSDWGNHTIRKIVIATGQVTTLAGSAGASGLTDGNSSAARFYYPGGITTEGSILYISDWGNHTIRKIEIASGQVTTLAGSAGLSGSTDDIGSTARFNHPAGITTDGTNLFVSDIFNHTIRKILISNGQVTTLAGSAGTSGSSDGNGTSASFNNPSGITSNGTNLYVSDGTNSTIRKIVIATGQVTTLAGSAGTSGSTDGNGSTARFYYPTGITTDGIKLYLTDSYNSTIRTIQ